MLKDDRRKNRLTPHVSRLTPSTAGPGDPAAHRTDRLPLLPSGPGGVHRVLSHRAQPLVHIEHSLKAQDTCGAYPPAINSIRPNRAGGSHEVRYGGSAILHRHNKMARSRHHLPQQMVAERVGFEPTVELPRRMLSKHVDSATLAPLHGRDSQRGGILTWALMSGKVNRGSSA